MATTGFFGLGGKKLPKPSELVKHCRDALAVLEKSGGNQKIIEKVEINISKCPSLLI